MSGFFKLPIFLVAVGCLVSSCVSMDRKSAGVRPPIELVLSFDDWTPDHYQIAVPELEKRGWRGVFCVIPGWIDSADFVKWEQLRDTIRRGHVVANHTYSHQLLGALCKKGQLAEARAEVARGRDRLEQMTGVRPDLLCLPGTSYSPEVGKIALEEGLTPMLLPRSYYGAWEKNPIEEIESMYARGVRYADFLVHGIVPSGRGWQPFRNREAFVAYLDAIKTAEKAGKVRITTEYPVVGTMVWLYRCTGET